ncbi:MAG: 5-oxoprolinase/urea amidolyase family protein [candidate division NC10 bacterium]|nr:5-oxoprolinase/urea amidolyase family protein [candidate division NC10 bacterium]
MIEVLRPGLLTTVQDRGRIGYQKFGVPASGAVDEIALRVGNILVGNAQRAAGMEITALGPQLRFLADAVVALTGAEVDADLDGKPVPCYQSFLVRAGQVLDVRTCSRGLRAYLAVAGGIDVPVLLGSRSTCLVAGFGGFHGRALAAGDVLRVGAPDGSLTSLCRREVQGEWRPHHESEATVRVVLGPQEDAFSQAGRHTFLDAVYRVSPHADRMGCRLDGPVIAHRDSADIISDWIPPGGVQVPGDGKPIILLADRQTTGGYPKIATVIGADIPLVAQSRPGDALRFRAISVKEARAIAREIEAALAALPARLVTAERWTYGAELGEVPGEIPLAAVGAAPRAVPSRVQPRGAAAVASPLPAQVVKVLGSPGDAIVAGQPLVVLMAMKMEHSVVAPLAGRIAAIHVREGDVVGAGDLLVTIEPAADAGGRVRGGEG